jgi:hypothetical protein
MTDSPEVLALYAKIDELRGRQSAIEDSIDELYREVNRIRPPEPPSRYDEMTATMRKQMYADLVKRMAETKPAWDALVSGAKVGSTLRIRMMPDGYRVKSA